MENEIYNAFAEWLNKLLENDMPENIKAYNFNLYEEEDEPMEYSSLPLIDLMKMTAENGLVPKYIHLKKMFSTSTIQMKKMPAVREVWNLYAVLSENISETENIRTN